MGSSGRWLAAGYRGSRVLAPRACYPGGVVTAAERLFTYDDILALPEHQVGELIAGELHVSPRPALPHALASSGLGHFLFGAYGLGGGGGPGGWWILDEPELHLGGDVLVPDLAGWRRERMPTLAAAVHAEVVPDWLCEVLSPSTAGLDRAKKLPRYAALGVAHVWLVDPNARTLEVYRHGGEAWIRVAVHAGDVLVRVEPFEAMELPLGRLWEL
ncbi:MAG: Uma2 family endonuclease [Myxococcales bacterium]|nr:Uma2 family endonuclease [Myxococcales bacterium]